MISLRKLFLELADRRHKDPFDDMLIQNYNVQEWRGNWAWFIPIPTLKEVVSPWCIWENLSMIKLKTLLSELGRQAVDLERESHSIQAWKNYWFTIRQPLRQAIFKWRQEGILVDDHYEDVMNLLDKMDEFWKALASQANRLLGGGLGPEDYADGP